MDTEKKGSKIACGLDCGTMHLVCARSDIKDVKITRNVFLKLDSEEVDISELSDISYVKSEEDKQIFIIGQDALLRLMNRTNSDQFIVLIST